MAGRSTFVTTARRCAASAALAAAILLSGCASRETRGPEPYRSIAVRSSASADATYDAPLYLINYDKSGRCESPQTLAQVVERARAGEFTDVVILSHGWNNDWPAATHLYNDFLSGFSQQLAQHPLDRPFKPMFVGVIWPSTLLMTAAERGPRYEAGAAPGAAGGARRVSSAELVEQDQLRREARDLASQLAGDDAAAARRIEQQIIESVRSGGGGQQLAELLAPACDDDEVERDHSTAAAALVAAARNAEQLTASPGPQPGAGAGPGHGAIGNNPVGNSPVGNRPIGNQPVGNQPAGNQPAGNQPAGNAPTGNAATTTAAPAANAPAASAPAVAAVAPTEAGPAAEASALPDPRWIVRAASVWMMKDRAGAVGANGVSRLVRSVLAGSSARVHLVGHSYGGKVVLSAVEGGGSVSRPVDSILLLEPAVSAYSFAAQVPHTRGAGKYRVVLDRVRQPILSTFSEDDWPLTQIYQYAVVRGRDLGEATPPQPPPPPNRYAALGGFGPQPLPAAEGGDAEFTWSRLREAPQGYVLPPKVRVCGLRSMNGQIACHGCISNTYTWWALRDQLNR